MRSIKISHRFIKIIRIHLMAIVLVLLYYFFFLLCLFLFIPFHCSCTFYGALIIAVLSVSPALSPRFLCLHLFRSHMPIYNFIDINAVGLLLRSYASHLFKQIIDRIHTCFWRLLLPKHSIRTHESRGEGKCMVYLHRHSTRMWLWWGVYIFRSIHLEIMKSLKVLQRVCTID